ncbi:hypothetical protein VPH35_054287 [Triticum aestivum]
MHDQVGVDLDGFPLDHEFPEDYGLEEEDDVDIEGEPLFEAEFANQVAGGKTKRKSRRTKAYTAAEDKLICECWKDIGQDPKTGAEQKASTFWTSCPSHSRSNTMASASTYPIVGGSSRTRRSSRRNTPPSSREGGGGRGEAVEEEDGEKPRPRGKTNSKKEDKRDAASNALIASVEGMMTKKDSREEERRRYKEEQMNAFMEA